MQMIHKSYNDEGQPTIIVKQSFLFFWERKREFFGLEESPKSYWKWVEMPKQTMVNGMLSFQLDTWNKMEVVGAC
jgi:hypothetical protein